MRSPVLPSWRKFRRPPLRLVLVVPFVLQVFAAVGLTGYLSLRNGQKTINDLALQLQTEVSHRIDQHLDSYLAVPHQIIEVDAKLIEQKQLDPHDFTSISSYFAKQVQSFDVSYINYGLITGEFAGAGYNSDNPADETLSVSETSAATRNINFNYTIDAQGQRQQAEPDPKYEHREEAWFSEAVRLNKPIWSQIYLWSGNYSNLSLAASRPIHNDRGQVVGAIAVDMVLSRISGFLRGLNTSPSGHTFIVERNGLLVAGSSPEQPFRAVNGKNQRIAAIDSSDPLTQATAEFLVKQFGDLRRITQPQQLEFWQQGQRQIVQVTPWRDKYGLDWLLVVAIPESDFMAQVNANTRITVLLCLATLGMTTLLGVLTSRWIAQPILHLSQAAAAVSTGKFDASIAKSNVAELEVLRRSFNHMTQQLQDSFSALETTNQHLEQANQALEKSNEVLEARVVQRTTKLSETLQHLQQAQAQLIQTEKMSSLGQMVAGIAHEINNPVNFIHGNLGCATEHLQALLELVNLYQKHYPQPIAEIQRYLEVADISFLKEDLPELLTSMQSGAWRIYEIIVNLRNFARLDETGIKAVDIHQGIDNALSLIQHRFQESQALADIQIIKNYSSLPPVECSPGQLNQVFINLLNNAVDALEEASQTRRAKESQNNPSTLSIETYTVELSATDSAATDSAVTDSAVTDLNMAQTQVVIKISDNGTGMPAAIQSKIFDPFFTTKAVGKGTGLGLSVSYQIIEQHRGQLSCNSTVGEGTEFTIVLPVRQSSASS